MNFIKVTSCALMCLFLQSCATPISSEKIASADYGPSPPENYEQAIRDRFSRTLIDPTAPLYTFSTPSRGYTKKSPLFNTEERFGWKVCGTVNSKNRYGGYVGSVPFFVLFKDGAIVEFIPGEVNSTGYSILNLNIQNVCNR